MDKERKELYGALAADIPIVREILDGRTTFAESLDQIAAAIEAHDDDAPEAFLEWCTAAAYLASLPLSQEEATTLAGYALTTSKSVSKRRNLTDALRIGLGGAAYAAGTYLKRHSGDGFSWQIATLYQVGGASLAGSTVYRQVRSRLNAKSDKATVDGYLDTLMATAKKLDKEVQEVFFPVNEELASAESGEAPAEPAHDEVA